MIFCHLFCITRFSTRAVLIAFLRIATHCLISAMRAGDRYRLVKRLCNWFAESLVKRVCCMIIPSEVKFTSVLSTYFICVLTFYCLTAYCGRHESLLVIKFFAFCPECPPVFGNEWTKENIEQKMSTNEKGIYLSNNNYIYIYTLRTEVDRT